MDMKKFLPFLSFAVFFAACSSKPAETETKTLQSVNQAFAQIDTAGLAQFQQWKSQNEIAATDIEHEPVITTTTAPVKEVTVIRERIVEKQVAVRKQSTPKQKVETTMPEVDHNTGPGTSETVANGSGTSEEAKEPVVTPEANKKEGWSKAAKGAAIGGAGGAVLGAIINKKNPAVGAVIGGVLGGAVGYGIGKGKDKKDGRY